MSESGWKALVIPTGSMRPTMPPGSLVLMRRVPTSSLKVGDVITYINPLMPTRTVSHRIIKKTMVDSKIPGFITKGDANKVADVPIVAGSVLGKVVWHIPHVGYWLIDAKNPLVILPIVYLAALLVMAEEVKRLSDYLKSQEPYRLWGFRGVKKPSLFPKFAAVTSATTIAAILIGIFAWQPVLALLHSNTVALTDNRISVAPTSSTTGCDSNNNVNVNSSTDQSASSGNATSSGNTSGGGATTGSSSNNSSTNVNISITNC